MKTILLKINGLPQAVKASAAFLVASVLSSGISYLVTPVYTRLLSAEEYGQTALFLTWLQIFGIIAMFCLSSGVYNNGMMDYSEKRDEYAFSMLILSNVITLCFSGILLCLYPIFSSYIKLELPYIILMCFVYFFQPAYNFWYCRQRYEMKYKTTVLWSVLSAFISPLVAIFCIFTADDDNKLFARIFGAEVTLIAFYIGFYIYLGVKAKFKIKTSYWKEAFLFNIPLIPHYLSAYLLTSVDRIMISNLIGDAQTAYYTVAHTVSGIIMIVWNAINASLVPFTYEKCKNRDYKAISNATLPILSLFAVMCLAVIMLAPEIVMIMATEDYMEAVYVIPPLIGGVFLQVHYFIYGNILYYYKKPVYLMLSSVPATILNVILNYIFISKFGYMAAGYTTIVCYLIQATINYLSMKKVVKEEIYNMKFIGLLTLSVLVISVLSTLLYNFFIARYLILFLVTVLCIAFRKKIINIFIAIRKKNN